MPAPVFEVFIDVDEDGIFETGELVQDDVRQINIIGRGKDLVTRRPRAAQLRMVLNNEDHKYTPTNPSSPLFPFQLPGPDCRVRMAYPLDQFGGSDGDGLDTRDFPLARNQSQSDPNYSTWAANSQFEIRSNHIEITSGAGQRIAQVEVPANFLQQKTSWGARILREGTGISYPYKQSLFVFRYQDASNYNEVALEQTTANDPLKIKINKVVATVLSNYGSAVIENDIESVWAADAEARVEFELQNQEIYVTVDGHVATVHRNVSSFLTEGGIGIGGESLSSNAAVGGAGTRRVQWDDFGGWVTKFTGRVDRVIPSPGQTQQLVTIEAFDDLERAQIDLTYKASPALPADADDIFNTILDGIGIPSTKRLIDSGTNNITVDLEKTMSRNGYTELIQIMEDDVGFFWVDGHGNYRYEDNDHRSSVPHSASPAFQLRDTRAGAIVVGMVAPLEWEDGMRRIQNEVLYRYDRASRASGAQVWTLEVDDNILSDTTRAKVGSALQYFADDIGTIGEEANAIDVRVPIPTTDFNINSLENGTGTNWLTSIGAEVGTVTMPTDFSQLDDSGQNFQGDVSLGGRTWTRTRRILVVVDASSNRLVSYIEAGDPDADGTRVNLSDEPENNGLKFLMKDSSFSTTDTPLTYNIYVAGGYIIPGFEGNFQIFRIITDRGINDIGVNSWIVDAQIVGEVLTASNPTAARVLDSASQLKFGRRNFDHKTLHVDKFSTARQQAEKLLANRKDQQPSFKIPLINKEYIDLMAIMYGDVSDKMQITYSDMGISGDNYFLEGYQFNVINGEGGKILTAEWETLKE